MALAYTYSGQTIVLDYYFNNSTVGSNIQSFSCLDGLASSLVLSTPQYIGVNETKEIKAYYKTDTNQPIKEQNTSVWINLNNKSYNMTFVNDTDEAFWISYLKSNSTEDIEINISAFSDNYVCKSQNDYIKFRIPYYVTLRLYRYNKNYTNAEAYTNEFQYVYLKFGNATTPLLRDMSYLDRFFIKVHFPYYKRSFNRELDLDTAFWDTYQNGESYIKLYDLGNYSINLLSTDTMGVNWDYEFIYPQYDEDAVSSKVENSVDFQERKNYNIKIYVDMWEISKFNVIMNFVAWGAILLGWVLITGFVLYVTNFSWKAGLAVALAYWIVVAIMNKVMF